LRSQHGTTSRRFIQGTTSSWYASDCHDCTTVSGQPSATVRASTSEPHAAVRTNASDTTVRASTNELSNAVRSTSREPSVAVRTSAVRISTSSQSSVSDRALRVADAANASAFAASNGRSGNGSASKQLRCHA